MGTLYLNSGESIIQTTDRIGVNSIPSDLVLTTRRLILVDSTHGTAEPLMIPFATILSLQGGWNSNGDPVITLTLTDTGGMGSTQLLDLVFFQQSHEHRKEECDGWVKYLMDHIVLAHQKTICTYLPMADQERGMQPSIRRGVAPEMIRPHTSIVSSRPVPSGEVMTPHQPDPLEVFTEEGEESPVAQIPVTPDVIDSSPVPEHEPESPDTISSPLPVDIVLPEIHREGASSMTTIAPPEPKIITAGEPPAGEIPPKTPSSPSPAPGSRSHTLIVAIMIGMIILAIAGGVGFYSLYLKKNDIRDAAPSITPTPSVSQTPTLPQVTIPQNGVWVRVVCNSTFLGWIGNPGSLHMVSGSGDQFYMIQNSDGLVQASFQKQEYTGDSLTIEIYNKGSLITHRTVRAPKGTIELIIDANTGNPPGVPLGFTK